jgi:hypothetical protein
MFGRAVGKGVSVFAEGEASRGEMIEKLFFPTILTFWQIS